MSEIDYVKAKIDFYKTIFNVLLLTMFGLVVYNIQSSGANTIMVLIAVIILGFIEYKISIIWSRLIDQLKEPQKQDKEQIEKIKKESWDDFFKLIISLIGTYFIAYNITRDSMISTAKDTPVNFQLLLIYSGIGWFVFMLFIIFMGFLLFKIFLDIKRTFTIESDTSVQESLNKN